MRGRCAPRRRLPGGAPPATPWSRPFPFPPTPTMASSGSPPPGFPHRWQREATAESVSSASPPPDKDHVSGLGISSASTGNSVGAAPRQEVAAVAPVNARGRVQDRLVWEKVGPSKKTLWRRRVEERSAAEEARRRASEMEGLCFRCYQPGHKKMECTNDEVCIRCWQVGHPAKECKRPRSPSTEEELRNIALAKLARRRSPDRAGQGGPRTLGGARRSSPPAPLPPPPPPPPKACLPPLEAWPPLRVVPVPEASLVEAAPCHAEEARAPLCVVRRSAIICDLEQRLRFAMVVSVGGRRPAVTCEHVAEALCKAGIPAEEMSVHYYAPEDFLVVLASSHGRSLVAALPPVFVAGAPMLLRPWNRQAQATLVPLRHRVSLVLEGLPPNAWATEVVEDLLGKSCVVLDVAPETKSRKDMSLFRLTASTSELADIPVARTLAVPEPVEAGNLGEDGDVKTLQYKILIHVTSVEEDAPPSLEGRLGSAEDGRGGGHGGGGGNSHGARRTRYLTWRRGVPDRPRGSVAVQRGSGHGGATCAAAPPLAWGLPELEKAAPLVFQNPNGGSSRQDLGASAKGASADKVSAVVVQPEGPRPEGAAKASLGVDCDDTGVPVLPSFLGKAGVLDPKVMTAKEQVLWEDAADSLPWVGTGNEEEQENEDELGKEDKLDPEPDPEEDSEEKDTSAELYPSGSSADYCAGANIADIRPEEYVLVPVSGPFGDRSGPRVGPSQVGSWRTTSSVGLGSPCQSYTGPNSNMQLVPRTEVQHPEIETTASSGSPGLPVDTQDQMTESVERVAEVAEQLPEPPMVQPQETVEQQAAPVDDKIRQFCAKIIKALAPPLLREIESTSKLRAEAEPFTPKRITRRSTLASGTAGNTTAKKKKQATQAETVLLKALGITAPDLEATEEDLIILQHLFTSPMKEQHLRTMAAIFGKMMPSCIELTQELPEAVEVA